MWVEKESVEDADLDFPPGFAACLLHHVFPPRLCPSLESFNLCRTDAALARRVLVFFTDPVGR